MSNLRWYSADCANMRWNTRPSAHHPPGQASKTPLNALSKMACVDHVVSIRTAALSQTRTSRESALGRPPASTSEEFKARSLGRTQPAPGTPPLPPPRRKRNECQLSPPSVDSFEIYLGVHHSGHLPTLSMTVRRSDDNSSLAALYLKRETQRHGGRLSNSTCEILS